MSSQQSREKVERMITFFVTPSEFEAYRQSAEMEELPYRRYLRRLIVKDAKERGLWPPKLVAAEVPNEQGE